MRQTTVTETVTLHPSILRLAKAMQAKLERDHAKGPWEEVDPWTLLHGLLTEAKELADARGDWYQEAADVANYAMMFADASEVRRRAAAQGPR